MQFMADCVVALKLRIVDQIALRYVQVIKYRGSSFAENEAPLVIGASGMEVADIGRGSVLLTTIRGPADVMRSNAAPLFVRVAKAFGGLPRSPEERIIKTSILGDV